MSANPQVATPAATPEPAPAPAQGTPAPAAAPAAPASEPQVKTFFSKKAEGTKAEQPDFSKLSPELQNAYKSMQGDYTRKTQELADMRREFEGQQATLKAEREAMQKSQEAILEAIRNRTPAEGAPQPTDIPSQIQALRDEGRYREADLLFADFVKQAALQEVAPLKQQAETDRLQSAFTKTAMNVVTTNPVVAEYRDEVVKVFDAPTPIMQKLRSVALASPENVQTFVPMILNAIATEIHARTLESRLEEMATAKAKSIVEAGRAKARSVPPSLVSSAGVSRETRGEGGGLDGAIKRAMEKLQGA